MPTRSCPSRLAAQRTTPSHRRRPWIALPESARLQLAQQIARLLQRLWVAEARHADRK